MTKTFDSVSGNRVWQNVARRCTVAGTLNLLPCPSFLSRNMNSSCYLTEIDIPFKLFRICALYDSQNHLKHSNVAETLQDYMISFLICHEGPT